MNGVLFRCCGKDVVGETVAIPGGGHHLACEHCGKTLDALTAKADAVLVAEVTQENAELRYQIVQAIEDLTSAGSYSDRIRRALAILRGDADA